MIFFKLNVLRKCPPSVSNSSPWTENETTLTSDNGLHLPPTHNSSQPFTGHKPGPRNKTKRFLQALRCAFSLGCFSYLAKSRVTWFLKKLVFQRWRRSFVFKTIFLHCYNYLISIYGRMFLLAAHINSLLCLQSWQTKD